MKERKGFSLIELLVAMSLLAIVASLPMADVFIRNNVRVRNYIQALNLQKAAMENLDAIGYDNVSIADDGDTSDLNNTANPDYTMPEDTINGVVFKRFYNIADNVPSPDLKVINLYVAWTDRTGSHVLQTSTVKAKY